MVECSAIFVPRHRAGSSFGDLNGLDDGLWIQDPEPHPNTGQQLRFNR